MSKSKLRDEFFRSYDHFSRTGENVPNLGTLGLKGLNK